MGGIVKCRVVIVYLSYNIILKENLIKYYKKKCKQTAANLMTIEKCYTSVCFPWIGQQIYGWGVDTFNSTTKQVLSLNVFYNFNFLFVELYN